MYKYIKYIDTYSQILYSGTLTIVLAVFFYSLLILLPSHFMRGPNQNRP